MIGRIISAAFQFRFMALAVDVIDRHGPSKEMRHHLQPKKTKVTLYYLCILQQNMFYLSYITNKTECLSFKSGCVVRVEMMKCDTSYSQVRPS